MPRRVIQPDVQLAVGHEQETPKRERRAKAPDASTVAKITHDPVNEQVIIAACIVDPPTRKKLAKTLLVDGFFAKGHPLIWSTLCEIERRGLQYDPATVKQLSGGIVDTEYVELLVSQRPVLPPNLQFHIEAFLWDRRRIETARGPVASLVEALQDPTTEPDKLRALARSVGGSFDGSASLRYLRDPEVVTTAAKNEIDQRRDRFAKGDICHPYGIPGLDIRDDGKPRLVPGMAPKQMTLIVGASGNGKTTLTNQICLALANRGERVLHGAWEQNGETNLQMLAGYSLGLSRTRLWTGDLTDEEVVALGQEIDRLGGSDRPLVRFFELPFDRSRGEPDRRRRSVNDVNLDVIHEHVDASGCGVAIFDLVAKALAESKPDEEKRALDRLLGIAVETRTHLISLHHLNKGDLEKRPDRAPTREAIKGGTHWIDAFDTILGVHIPGVWKDIPMDTMEIRILKQRYGVWPIAVELQYDAASGIVSGGKEIPFEQADNRYEFGSDDFLDAEPRKPNRKRGR